MKSISFSVVEANLTKREYLQPLVELVAQYPEKDGKKTFEYQFKRQNASKISIPVELLDKLSFMQDENNKLYLVCDGIVVERVIDSGFKRVQLTAAYRPASDAKKQEAVE